MGYSMRITYQVLGGHTHVSIWTGKAGYTHGKAGNIVMTNEEFTAWKNGTIITEWVEKEKG